MNYGQAMMKKKIDGLLAEDDKLQAYLQWLYGKTTIVNIKYQPEDFQEIQKIFEFYVNIERTLSRFFYFGLDLFFNLNRNLNRNLNLNLYLNLYLYLYLNLNLYLYLYLYLYRNLYLNLYLYLYLYLYLDRNLELAKEYDPELYKALLKLKDRLPDVPDEKNINETEFKQWWQENGKAWTEDIRNAMIKYQNIGHDWQFSDEQKALLEQYYRANQFLTKCLHQDCYVSPEVCQEIEETLLLPFAEIEKRRSK